MYTEGNIAEQISQCFRIDKILEFVFELNNINVKKKLDFCIEKIKCNENRIGMNMPA